MANCVWMDTGDDGPSVGSEVLRRARIAAEAAQGTLALGGGA